MSELTAAQKRAFTKLLMHWHELDNRRSLPWIGTKDPYKIWLSEIILQQTRAAQGTPYYLKFTENFPDVHSLAAADDEFVFRLWQGLGYYNRCRNMLAAARTVVAERKGIFPKTYDEILQMKGVGSYTAAAIASFAYDLPHAVLDGNVYRVLSRFFGLELPTDAPNAKQFFSDLAQSLLDKSKPAAFNQAIMDFGAVVCTPKKPDCAACPLAKRCVALRKALVDLLPVKSKKTKVRDRFFQYFVLRYRDEIFLSKRAGNDIWQDLHEFFGIETELAADELTTENLLQQFALKTEILFLTSMRQRLTHQLVHTSFYLCKLKQKPKSLAGKGFWVPVSEIDKYAFPKTLVAFMQQHPEIFI